MTTSWLFPPHDFPPTESASTRCVADFPVRTSRSRAGALSSPAHARGYGANIDGSFASYDLASFSWKTRQACFLEEWEPFSGTWPRSGMMRNGIVYRLPVLAPLTKGIASGLSPTLLASDQKAIQARSGARAPRSFYPTLTCQDASNNGAPSQHLRNTPPLNAVVNGPLNPMWAEWFMGFPVGWTGCISLGTR